MLCSPGFSVWGRLSAAAGQIVHRNANGCKQSAWRGLATAPQIFDEAVKTAQKARAAAAADAAEYYYLRDEAATRVVERVCDIRRNFERTLDLGAGTGHVRRALDADPDASSAVGELIEMDAFEGCAGTIVPDLTRKIPLPDASVGLVLSCGWMHWVNDLGGLLSEANRVLKPDGALLAAMPAADTLRELRTALQLAEDEIVGGIAPRVSPFVRPRDAGGALTAAGFVMSTVDTEPLVVRYKDMFALMRHLRGMGESNAVRVRKPHVARTALDRAAEIYEERFGHELGGVSATFHICHMIGWKKAAGQQKPLERGSAEFSLQDLAPKE